MRAALGARKHIPVSAAIKNGQYGGAVHSAVLLAQLVEKVRSSLRT
jgi:hypothetical protein